MHFHLKIWRQQESGKNGRFQEVEARDIPAEASFLEMLDIVNDRLSEKGGEPVAFDHDCREGICGACSMTINGIPQGPGRGTACQLYMRSSRTAIQSTLNRSGSALFPWSRTWW